MKIKYYIGLITLIACVFLTACERDSDDSKVDTQDKKYFRLKVINATENEEGVWRVSWPRVYVELRNSTSVFHDYVKDSPGKALEDLSQEELEYFMDYIDSYEEPDFLDGKVIGKLDMKDYEGHVYLGSVSYDYEDSQGRRTRTIDIFDEFPEGYDEFVKAFNDVCEDEYIVLGDPIEMSADYYKRMTFFTDAMVDGGTIEDFLSVFPTDVYHIMNDYNEAEAQSAMENFQDYYFYKYFPKEIEKADSTEEELREYTVNLMSYLGIDPSNIYTMNDGGLVTNTGTDEFGEITVYRTCDYPNEQFLREKSYDGLDYIVLQDPRGPDELVIEKPVLYSEDSKFIMEMDGGSIVALAKIIYGGNFNVLADETPDEVSDEALILRASAINDGKIYEWYLSDTIAPGSESSFNGKIVITSESDPDDYQVIFDKFCIGCPFEPQFVFCDVNYDGTVEVLTDLGRFGNKQLTYYNCYCFDESMNSYVSLPGFNGIANPATDTKQEYIFEVFNIPNGATYTAYRFDDDGIVPVHTVKFTLDYENGERLCIIDGVETVCGDDGYYDDALKDNPVYQIFFGENRLVSI